MGNPVIMVVEDETIVSKGIQLTLQNMGYETTGAVRTGEQAVSRALAERPDLVLMDISLKGEMDGIEAARQIRAASAIPIIFLTAFSDDEKIERSKLSEPSGYIIKPFDERELKAAIETGLYRARIEQRLKESESKYRFIVENQNDLVVKFDAQERLLRFVTPTFCDTFGRKESELIGEKFMPLIHEDDRKQVAESLASLKNPPHTTYHEERLMTVNGWRWFGWSARAILDEQSVISEIISVGRDITDRKMLEKQLRQAQKMEAIGTLAGGIAHDFNNILSSVLGFTELSMDEVNKDSTLYDNLHEVLIAGKRARDLVQQILAFSRQSDRKMVPMNVAALLQETKGLLRSTIPTSIDMAVDIRQENCAIEGDATQIHQVIINLCTNAAHAMEEGGRLNVILEKTECDARDGEIPPGKYALMTVKDSGHGMAPEVLDRIFEPYFTTKATGKGTGMGLALVYGIVKSHNGQVTVESQEGKGAVFRVYLPLVDEQDPDVGPLNHKTAAGGNEHILVVDDEPQVADFQKQVLERLGYRVRVETDSIAALQVFKTESHTFDAVITDMTMPQMTGGKLAWELRKIRADIPIILCTGYSDKMSKEKAKEMGINAFLMKPVGMADLAKTLRRVLNG